MERVLAEEHERDKSTWTESAGALQPLAAATKVAGLGDNGRSLVTRIRKDQQAVSEILYGGERGLEQAPSEELEKVGQ